MLRFLGNCSILFAKEPLRFRFKCFGFLEKKNRRCKTYKCEKKILFLSNKILFILFRRFMTLLRLLGFVNILKYHVRKINAVFPIYTKYFAIICDYEFWKFLFI